MLLRVIGRSILPQNVFLFIIGCAFSFSASADRVIKFSNVTDGNGYYALSLLKLINTHMDQPYRLEEIHSEFTQPRQVEEVRAGNLDIMWAATSQELENMLEPVRIPLYKGLLGHRVLLIRADDQARFDQVKTLDDLRRIPLGQGAAWADTKILEANGLKVIKTAKTQGLFSMLDGSRFDGFPRGIFEPFAEVVGHPNLSLAVEKRLMLVYKMPYYFFVNPDNKPLARELEGALNRAIADGSFEKVFLSSPNVKEALEKGDMKNRLIFNLDNPGLPKLTPVGRPELWVDTKNL